MADVSTNGKHNEDWEYEDEDADDYEWEYSEEEEEEEEEEAGSGGATAAAAKKVKDEIPLDEQDLPDPFSAAPLKATTKTNGNKVHDEENGEEEAKDDKKSKKHHHRKHKKSKHSDRIEMFENTLRGGEERGHRSKKIHVRSKDPSRIARQFEKGSAKEKRSLKNGRGGKVVVPPPIKVTTICKNCGKEPYVAERVVAEKAWWHKNCFRCKTCNKSLTLDTYMSHEGVLYCKQHHSELFRPKAVVNREDDIKNGTQDAIRRHKEQERRMETIIRENKPVPSGAVNSSAAADDDRYSGLDRIDVGSKYRMFEKRRGYDDDDDVSDYDVDGGGGDDDDEDVEVDPEIDDFLAGVLAGADERERSMLTGGKRSAAVASAAEDEFRREPRESASDRYGIMDKLKRLQEGADLDDLLAEMDEELPSDEDQKEENKYEREEDYGLTEVQKRSLHGPFGEQERKDRLAEKRKRELAMMRSRVTAGLPKENKFDYLEDNVLNSSANKFKKTQVDVRSENASKFREMFDKGEAPEDIKGVDRSIVEKEAELELMRKGKRQQRDFFKKLESGTTANEEDQAGEKKEPKLLVGKLKTEKNGDEGGDYNDEIPEMASLSSRFAFFENAKKKEEEEEKRRRSKLTPPRLRSHIFEDPTEGEEAAGGGAAEAAAAGTDRKKSEVDHARRECKARSVLNKFKEMEQKVMNGEEEVAERPKMKRFTPPRKGTGSQTESEYSDSDSDSYTGSSYTSSDYTDSESEEEVDETLRAMKDAARAKALRAKFEEWENSQDAAEQARQIALHDENGDSLQSAGLLRKRFEALQLMQQQQEETPPPEPRRQRYQPRKFK